MLVDSHCHLDWFKNPSENVENARKNKVERILTNATNLKNIQSNLDLASQFPEVDCGIGIHPVDLLSMNQEEIKEGLAMVRENIEKAICVGEVGLDFKYAKDDQKDGMEKVFREFITIAIETNKPIVVHARYAETQCLNILEEMQAKKVHMHWFTNSKKTSKRACELGYFISCGPIIISDQESAEIVKEIPLENLMLETDAPVPFMGEQSEPSWIPRVCEKLAESKSISIDEVEKITGNNYVSLFGEKI